MDGGSAHSTGGEIGTGNGSSTRKATDLGAPERNRCDSRAWRRAEDTEKGSHGRVSNAHMGLANPILLENCDQNGCIPFEHVMSSRTIDSSADVFLSDENIILRISFCSGDSESSSPRRYNDSDAQLGGKKAHTRESRVTFAEKIVSDTFYYGKSTGAKNSSGSDVKVLEKARRGPSREKDRGGNQNPDIETQPSRWIEVGVPFGASSTGACAKCHEAAKAGDLDEALEKEAARRKLASSASVDGRRTQSTDGSDGANATVCNSRGVQNLPCMVESGLRDTQESGTNTQQSTVSEAGAGDSTLSSKKLFIVFADAPENPKKKKWDVLLFTGRYGLDLCRDDVMKIKLSTKNVSTRTIDFHMNSARNIVSSSKAEIEDLKRIVSIKEFIKTFEEKTRVKSTGS